MGESEADAKPGPDRAPAVKPVSVFDYLDYRELLRDRFTVRKEGNPSFSLRYIASKTGLSASLLTRVLKGQRNLNPAAAVHLSKVFGFQDAERDFLETLIMFGQA
ncbi:MAG TPA: TIGR02147 family protein, partial [Pirellulaceae bacterium]